MTIQLKSYDAVAITSSKGNQEKWLDEATHTWIKLDQFGYEALAEVISAELLKQSNINKLGFTFATYHMTEVTAHGHSRTACASDDFLQKDEIILTLADLLTKGVGAAWQTEIAKQRNLQQKVKWLVEKTVALTGLENFGQYLTVLFELDMMTLNEDRHLNNIAVLRRGEQFDYCPMFDFGAGMLSNTRDYPIEIDPKALIRQVKARPLNGSFTRQVRAAQALYGRQLNFKLDINAVAKTLDTALEFYQQRDQSYLRERIYICIETQYQKLL